MLDDQLTFWAGVVVSIVVLAVLSALFCSNTRLPLHPGPPPKLLSGNIHQIPGTAPWAAFAEWSRQYGMILLCIQTPAYLKTTRRECNNSLQTVPPAFHRIE